MRLLWYYYQNNDCVITTQCYFQEVHIKTDIRCLHTSKQKAWKWNWVRQDGYVFSTWGESRRYPCFNSFSLEFWLGTRCVSPLLLSELRGNEALLSALHGVYVVWILLQKHNASSQKISAHGHFGVRPNAFLSDFSRGPPPPSFLLSIHRVHFIMSKTTFPAHSFVTIKHWHYVWMKRQKMWKLAYRIDHFIHLFS